MRLEGSSMNLDDFRCMRRGVQLATLDNKDAKLLKAFNQRGKGQDKALLLIHGFTSTPAVFRQLTTSLTGYDAIVAPVLPGHGESIEAFSQVKASEWIDYVKTVCATLTEQFKQVDILGLSLGGMLACYLDRTFKLNHLYLLAPCLDLQLALPGSLKLAKVLNRLGFCRLRSAAGNLLMPHHCEIAYRQLPIPAVIEILSLVKQFEFSPPRCPTDLFLGCYDEVVDSRKVAARFANCDNTTIHWLRNSAHVIPLDGDVEVILQCVKDQLEM